MFWEIVLLIVGMALLIKGADFFVDGASNIAKALKIPTFIIGLTLVSLGTTLPEASVSITSAINNMNDMSLGNAVGSNIVNTLLILGLSAVIMPIAVDPDIKKFYAPILIGIYGILIVFCFVITPYRLDRLEAITLLILFFSYMIFVVFRAKKTNLNLNEEKEEYKKIKPTWLSSILVVVGVVGIVFGGNFVVNNASKIAIRLGMSEILVGLTIVAVGTSLPELVTSVVASVKKENDIAIGNVVGASFFNVAWILGMSATISPLTLNTGIWFDILVATFTAVLLLTISLTCKKLGRGQGSLMVLAYVGYLTYIIIRN